MDLGSYYDEKRVGRDHDHAVIVMASEGAADNYCCVASSAVNVRQRAGGNVHSSTWPSKRANDGWLPRVRSMGCQEERKKISKPD